MKTCVITLDLINAICHPDGSLACYADRIISHNVIEHSNQLTDWARQEQHVVVHVRVGFRDGYQDGSSISPLFSAAKQHNILKLTSWDCQFCDDLQREKSDIIINKHRVSAFYGTDLDLILRANRIQRLILCGVATNNAVELTAREAHDRDYHVTVIDDASQTVSDEEQQASLNFLKKITTILSTQACTQ